ncbi:redoxin domain-containing protein [Komarekiella sp. 'clone 1']|uniref:Redoxin domain-containing protein n=1 Tax=Komarekiella delphini-convector SJRDD-AB1 TaxID=2593771 RepID=A0AA40VVW6_9NOST|nr:redoxin domain-containing protein [Komarekiella delphini-convector]MBD6621298.1 redoxin domain-containing protein [Komarekiella delphini-convector SJRDD-AB1]
MMTTNTTKLFTGTQVPELAVKTFDGKLWKLSEQQPQNFTLIIFYRGWFCPICHNYLAELERLLDDFTKLGVEAIAISGDSQADAQNSIQEWEIKNLTVGYEGKLLLRFETNINNTNFKNCIIFYILLFFK